MFILFEINLFCAQVIVANKMKRILDFSNAIKEAALDEE